MEHKIFPPLIFRLGDPNLKSAKSCKLRLSFAKAFFRSELWATKTPGRGMKIKCSNDTVSRLPPFPERSGGGYRCLGPSHAVTAECNLLQTNFQGFVMLCFNIKLDKSKEIFLFLSHWMFYRTKSCICVEVDKYINNSTSTDIRLYFSTQHLTSLAVYIMWLGWDLAIARYQPRPCGQQGGFAPILFQKYIWQKYFF